MRDFWGDKYGWVISKCEYQGHHFLLVEEYYEICGVETQKVIQQTGIIMSVA